MYEQAKISGASIYQMFRDITLPNLRSAILLVVLLRGMFMFNKFDAVWLLTKGGPLGATETLPVYIYRRTFFEFDLALGSAAAINLFLILAVVATVYFWYFKPSKEVAT
jgi:multiple sugar transport system permease protein